MADEVPQIRLTNEARNVFIDYLSRNTCKYLLEKQRAGIDPIAHPDKYFQIELKEPEHSDVLSEVKATTVERVIPGSHGERIPIPHEPGTIDDAIIYHWIRENRDEPCDITRVVDKYYPGD